MARGRHPRRIKVSSPDQATAEKYLYLWRMKELHYNLAVYPPLTSARLFERVQPLEMEVGCGVGEFLCDLALNNPTTNFLGIELAIKSIYKAVEIAASLALDNIKFIRANVRQTYPLWQPESLHMVYLHFPDPCYKQKYRKNRLLDDTFLDHVHRALVPDGQLSVMTDQAPFFMDMLTIVEADPRFEKMHPQRYLIGFEDGIKSRYQKIWESRGLTTLRFLLQKPLAPAEANEPLPELTQVGGG